MHELSIAQNLVSLAVKAAEEVGVSQVKAVHLRLGGLSGVVKETLLFCYDVATEGTPLEGSRLIIKDAPLLIFCPACDTKHMLTNIQMIYCPACGSIKVDVIEGRELQITHLEVGDAVAVA